MQKILRLIRKKNSDLKRIIMKKVYTRSDLHKRKTSQPSLQQTQSQKKTPTKMLEDFCARIGRLIRNNPLIQSISDTFSKDKTQEHSYKNIPERSQISHTYKSQYNIFWNRRAIWWLYHYTATHQKLHPHIRTLYNKENQRSNSRDRA